VTVVVIQGIFGEFFNRPSFQELLAEGPTTAFGKAWARKLANHKNEADKRDAMFSLSTLKDEEYPLSELARDLVSGAQELTTPSRLAWWRTHTVPSRLKYYSFVGTMGDPSTKDRVWPLTLNEVAYTPGSTDFKNLRSSYYDIYKESGQALNDSQVAYSRSRFWPELHKALNPDQGPIEAHVLAIFGEDHWGVTLPRVIEDSSGAVSPFPRITMLKALATFLAGA
jgi:hypothetical protein